MSHVTVMMMMMVAMMVVMTLSVGYTMADVVYQCYDDDDDFYDDFCDDAVPSWLHNPDVVYQWK